MCVITILVEAFQLNLHIPSQATAFPFFALFTLRQHRVFAVSGALTYALLQGVLIVPNRHRFIRKCVVLSFGLTRL